MQKQRLIRAKSRTLLALNDLKRAYSWHIGKSGKYFRSHWQDVVEKYKWCFIVGCNNSGTTLMQDLLEKALPVSSMPHEGQKYTRALHRGSRKGHERVWTEFIDDLQMSDDSSLSCAPHLVHDWMLEFKIPKQQLLLEKTTVNAVRMRWLQKVFPSSYFIGLVRNGFAVAEGINRKGNKDYVRAARHWSAVNKIMLDDSKHISNFILIKYEELTAHPYLCLERIAKFLEMEKSILASEQDLSAILTSIKNMNDKSIKKLRSNDIKLINENASEMLSYFEYEF